MTTETKSDSDLAERFIKSLFKLGRGPRAELKRALQHEHPGNHPPVFRYVEPYVPRNAQLGTRDCYYLVAALFGLTEKEDELEPNRLPLARAVRRYAMGNEAASDEISPTEKRFLALLDADNQELPHRLRQVVRMVTSGTGRINQQLNWQALLIDLIDWNKASRKTQTSWAREFYNTQDQSQTEEETP